MKRILVLILIIVFIMGTTAVPSYAENLSLAAAALCGEMLTADNEPLNAVTKNLVLPSEIDGVSISWSSNNKAIDANTGSVTRSLFEDKEVTLTADFGSELTKEFLVTVLAKNKKVLYSDNFNYDEISAAIQDVNSNWKKSKWIKDVDSASTTIETEDGSVANHILKSERIENESNDTNYHNFGYYEFPVDSFPKGNVMVSYKMKATSASGTFDIKFGGIIDTDGVYSYDTASSYIKGNVRYTSGNGAWLETCVNLDFENDEITHSGAGELKDEGNTEISGYAGLSRIYIAPFRNVLTVNEIDDIAVIEIISDEEVLNQATDAEKMEYVETQIKRAVFTQEDSRYITQDITIPTLVLPDGISVEWSSTDEAVLSSAGEVKRARAASNVSLLATVKLDGYEDITVNVPFTVMEEGTTLIKNESFDSYSAGEKINDKSTLWGQYPASTENNPIQGDILKESGKGNVVKVSRVKEGSGQVYFKGSQTDESNRFIYEAEVKFTQTGSFDIRCTEGSSAYKRLFVSSRININDLEDASKNSIGYAHYDTDGITGRTYSFYGIPVGEWITFAFDVNRLSKTFDIYMNGEKLNTRPCPLYFKHADSASAQDLTEGTVGQWMIIDVPTQDSAMYVDNVSVRTYKEDYAKAYASIANALFNIPRTVYNRGIYNGYVIPDAENVTIMIDGNNAVNNEAVVSKLGKINLSVSASSGDVSLTENTKVKAAKICITDISFDNDATRLERGGLIKSITFNGKANGDKLMVAVFEGNKLDSVNLINLNSEEAENNIAEINVTATAEKPGVRMYLYNSAQSIVPMMNEFVFDYTEPEE